MADTNNVETSDIIIDPKLSLISASFKVKTMDVSKLVTDDRLNVRESYDFDIGGMLNDILRIGRITNPIVAMQDDEVFTVLQGNRRTKGAKAALALPNCPPEVRDNLKKTTVLVYQKDQLTEQDILTLVCDEGTTRLISRLAIVRTVWRLYKMGFSEKTIGVMMMSQLSRFTRNEEKAANVPEDATKRAKYISDWFRGTLGGFILAAARFPQFAKDQFLLTHKAEDKKLVDGEKLLVKMKRARVTDLNTAKGEDEKAGVWDFETGGPAFNKLWADYLKVDSGEQTEEKMKRLSVKEVETLASAFSSKAVRAGFFGSVGKAPQNMAELDEETARQANIHNVLAEAEKGGLTNALLSDFIALLVNGRSGGVTEFLAPYLVVTE